MTTTAQIRKGGSWLIDDTTPADVFTPEKLTDEHQLMARTAQEFVDNEVLPATERLEAKDWELARSLVRRAADLGLFGIAVPEQYGGLDLDKASSLVVVERAAARIVFEKKDGAHIVRVGYEKKGADGLRAWFEEREPGKPDVHIEFPYTRVR